MATGHLQTLSDWLDIPDPAIRSLRKSPVLATHITLLEACGLISSAGEVWHCLPQVSIWLNLPFPEQIAWLRDPLAADETVWEGVVSQLGLGDAVTIDLSTYAKQQLDRLLMAEEEPFIPSWLKADEDEMVLPLNSTLPPFLLFHLLQLGVYAGTAPFRLTALSVARGAENGYTLPEVLALLQESTGKPLAEAVSTQVVEWYGRWDTYQLRRVYLLETKQPRQMAEIRQKRRLNQYVLETVSTHHVVVNPAMGRPLGRWLEKRGYRLSGDELLAEPRSKRIASSHYGWLGVKVLQGLGGLLPEQVRPSAAVVEIYEAGLSEVELDRLAIQAEQIVAGILQAVRGRDGLFPAERDIDEGWLSLLEKAIHDGASVKILYQGLNDDTARSREIYPMWIEQEGALFYLTAYCLTAEAERVFRVDRIRKIS